MDTLEKLTREIVEFPDFSVRDSMTSSTFYKLERGSAMSFDIYRSNELDVLRTYFSEDAIFPFHSHESDETLTLIQGEVTILIDDGANENRIEMKVGEPVHIKARDKHLLHSKKESWILAVIIPPDEKMLK